jgi:hypothetical protein
MLVRFARLSPHARTVASVAEAGSTAALKQDPKFGTTGDTSDSRREATIILIVYQRDVAEPSSPAKIQQPQGDVRCTRKLPIFSMLSISMTQLIRCRAVATPQINARLSATQPTTRLSIVKVKAANTRHCCSVKEGHTPVHQVDTAKVLGEIGPRHPEYAVVFTLVGHLSLCPLMLFPDGIVVRELSRPFSLAPWVPELHHKEVACGRQCEPARITKLPHIENRVSEALHKQATKIPQTEPVQSNAHASPVQCICQFSPMHTPVQSNAHQFSHQPRRLAMTAV